MHVWWSSIASHRLVYAQVAGIAGPKRRQGSRLGHAQHMGEISDSRGGSHALELLERLGAAAVDRDLPGGSKAGWFRWLKGGRAAKRMSAPFMKSADIHCACRLARDPGAARRASERAPQQARSMPAVRREGQVSSSTMRRAEKVASGAITVGSGDGFDLLHHVFGWPFSEARDRVMEAAGLKGAITPAHRAAAMQAAAIKVAPMDRAMPSDRVLRLRREHCAIENCDDAVDYLASPAPLAAATGRARCGLTPPSNTGMTVSSSVGIPPWWPTCSTSPGNWSRYTSPGCTRARSSQGISRASS